MTPTRLTFIGLGIMGSRMASHLISPERTLTVYNRSAEKAASLKERGAHVASSAKDSVRQAEVVFSMLAKPEIVQEMAFGPDGFVASMPSGSLWVDSSTVSPEDARSFAAQAAEHRVRYLEAPVAGTRQPAESGDLVFFVGGEEADHASVQPFFDLMGQKSIHMGKHGQAASIKILINLMLAQSMVAFSEATVLGESMGLDRELMHTILLNSPVTAPFLQSVAARLKETDPEVNFPLELMHKDLNLVASTAYAEGVAMPSANAAKEVFALAKQYGWAKQDFSSVFRFLTKEA